MSLKIFLQLLQSALWGRVLQPGSLEHDEFRNLLHRANKQVITGHILHALVENNIRLDKRDAVKSYTTLKDIEESNRKMNLLLHQLSDMLKARHITFIVVKGQTFIPLYRHGQHRMAGDVDFYIAPEHFHQAREIITHEWQVEMTADEDEAYQHLAFSYQDVDFEMHFCLKKFASKRNQRIFDDLLADNKPTSRSVNGRDIPILEPNLELLYTFLHLYHHLISKGVGLRQFCDLAILLHTHSYDARALERMLTDLNHLKAFRAIEAVLVHVIGLSEEKLPMPISDKDRAYIRPILRVVLQHGNFGAYGNRHTVRSGWGYYREAFSRKASNMRWAYTLSPRETRNMMLRALPHKIYLATRRQWFNRSKKQHVLNG